MDIFAAVRFLRDCNLLDIAHSERGCSFDHTLYLVQSLGGINIFILLSTTAFVYCAPLAYFMESHKWGATFEAAKASVGNQHLMYLMALSAVLYTVSVCRADTAMNRAKKCYI